MDKQNLINYLEDVYNIEKQKRIAKETMGILSDRYNKSNERYQYAINNRSVKKNSNRFIALGFFIWGILGLLVNVFYSIPNPDVETDSATPVIFLLIAVVSGFCYFRMSKQTSDLQKRVLNEAQETEKKMKTEMMVLKENYSVLNQANQSTQEILDKIYALNIVHPKYRYLEAIGMFLEYLSTGRTHSLEARNGDLGAYNLYEDELYKGLIINKLDQVLQNQRILIAGQRQIISQINTMIHDIDIACERLEKIQNVTQVNAFYNAVTAYNSSITKKILQNRY